MEGKCKRVRNWVLRTGMTIRNGKVVRNGCRGNGRSLRNGKMIRNGLVRKGISGIASVKH